MALWRDRERKTYGVFDQFAGAGNDLFHLIENGQPHRIDRSGYIQVKSPQTVAVIVRSYCGGFIGIVVVVDASFFPRTILSHP